MAFLKNNYFYELNSTGTEGLKLIAPKVASKKLLIFDKNKSQINQLRKSLKTTYDFIGLYNF